MCLHGYMNAESNITGLILQYKRIQEQMNIETLHPKGTTAEVASRSGSGAVQS